MKKIYFNKPKEMSCLLSHFHGVAVDSRKAPNVTYLAKNRKCGIVTVDGVAIWPEEETPSIIETLTAGIKAEAKEVFDEIRDWRRFR
jgi:hypothetical protein